MARLSLTIGKLDESDKVPTALIGSSKRSRRTSTAVGSVRFILGDAALRTRPWTRSNARSSATPVVRRVARGKAAAYDAGVGAVIIMA
jgi:hypothetical protein